jgi:hypothetical protein
MPQRRHAIALIGLGVFVLLGSLTYLLASAQTTPLALPQTLADLPLNTATYGPEAVTAINRLHGKEFPLAAGATGTYGNAGATLWVSQFASRAVAEQIVDAMRDKIAEGRSPFEPIGARQVEARSVYELAGLGQKHFYFQAQDRVIWLAVEPAKADQALAQLLEVYP